jgi:hypothetical protein
MDPEEVRNKRSTRRTLAVSGSNVHVEPSYEMTLQSDNEITNTGLLTVAELKPQKGISAPRFRFRWDEEANHLNVDALDVTPNLKKQFEDGKTGYYGHTVEVSSSKTSRTFNTKVIWEYRKLYEGEITVSFGFEKGAKATARVKAFLSFTVTRRCRVCEKQFNLVGNESTCPDCSGKI